MNNNYILIESDLVGNVSSSSSRMGMKSQSRSFSSISVDFKLEVIPLINVLEMEGTSG